MNNGGLRTVKHGLRGTSLLALGGLAGTLLFGSLWLQGRREAKPPLVDSPPRVIAPRPSASVEAEGGRDAVDLWRTEALRLQAVLARQKATAASVTESGLTLSPAFRTNLTDALLINDTRLRWQALKRLGLLPSADDFRRRADLLGSDWPAINEINQMLPAWLEADPCSAADWAMGLPAGQKKDQAVANIASQWARLDAAAVLQWMQVLPAGKTRDQVAGQYIFVAAGSKPQEAAGWALQIGDDNLRQNAVRSVASAWARQDPARASVWVDSLPAGLMRDQARQAGFYQLIQDKQELALEWYERIQDESFRQSMVPTVISYLARTDAGRAAAWLETMPASRWRDMAVQHFVTQLAATQGPLAIEWAESIADPGLRNSALSQAVGQWARQDAAAASEWVQSLPAGQAHDTAMYQFVIVLAATVPATAAEWAATIQDSSLRVNALTSVATQWLRKDRQAATQWLRTSPLSESSRQSVLRSISGN
jgi:hypothetical protein